jgi:hypothetical protein
VAALPRESLVAATMEPAATCGRWRCEPFAQQPAAINRMIVVDWMQIRHSINRDHGITVSLAR